MMTLLVMLEEGVRAEFGPTELAAVRAVAAERARGGSTLEKANGFLRALGDVRQLSFDDVLRWAGQMSVGPLLAMGLPSSRGHTSTRTLLLKLSAVIPEALKALAPGAVVPDVWEEMLSDDVTRIAFDGPESMALLLEGAAKGLGHHFSDVVAVARGTPPAALTERRIIDVTVRPERRSGSGSAPAVPPGERRKGALSGFNTFLR